MVWNGEERRSGEERRVVERRRVMRYSVHTLVVIDGITWVDPEGTDRRARIRRHEDRRRLASKILEALRP